MILCLFFLFCSLIHYSDAVFGGRYALPNEVSSMASIRSLYPTTPKGMMSICGGVLIAERIVLTAAHCVYKEKQIPIVVDVVVNDYNLYSADAHESARQTRAIDMLPDYAKTEDVQDDLAFLYLPRSVDYCTSDYGVASVARLPPSSVSQLLPVDPLQVYYNSPLTDEEIFSFSVCSISSWGMVDTGNYSHIPMNLVITLHKSTQPNTFMAKPAYGKFCFGDSGSPVFCTIRGKPYLVGILSEIGSFDQSKIPEFKKMSSLERCAAFDHAKLIDVRKRMPLIHKIIKRRSMEASLAEGQRKCKYN